MRFQETIRSFLTGPEQPSSSPGIGIPEVDLPGRVAPAGSGLTRDVHLITPVILGAYYLAGLKKIR